MFRVGQNHIYTVYERYFWQGNHQIYGHIRCIYMVLANPNHVVHTTFAHSHLHLSMMGSICQTLHNARSHKHPSICQLCTPLNHTCTPVSVTLCTTHNHTCTSVSVTLCTPLNHICTSLSSCVAQRSLPHAPYLAPMREQLNCSPCLAHCRTNHHCLQMLDCSLLENTVFPRLMIAHSPVLPCLARCRTDHHPAFLM
jgi:hypothetical protein